MQTWFAGVVTAALAVAPLAAGGQRQTPPKGSRELDSAARDGARDFDFLMGAWTVHNRALHVRLKGSVAWDEFEATNVARPLLDGGGNEDEYRTGYAGGFLGMSLRFFDRKTRQWSIYWADSRTGTLGPPVVGSFSGDAGTFEGEDTYGSQPVRVRYIWSRVTTPTPRWEQAFSTDGGKIWETNWVMDFTRAQPSDTSDFQVFELRRYAIKEGERANFARYFEAYFPEAFQQLGAFAFGEFSERSHPSWFTWIRGYKDMDARARVCQAFYHGPLWKEHRTTLNERMLDSDNVLLLHPFNRERGLRVLPAVDPVTEAKGAQGIVVAQIFAVKADQVEAFAREAEPTFAGYRAGGVREAGVLVTLDVPNNYPDLPVRTDGPYLVWFGILENEASLEARFSPLAKVSGESLSRTGLLRGVPELVLLDPAPRSRLRWLP